MGIVCLNFLAAKKHKKIKNTSSRDFFCRFRGENRNYSVVLGVKIRNYSVVLGRENRNYSVVLGVKIRNYSVVLGVKIRNYSFVLGRENRNYSIFSCRFGVDVSPTRHSRLFQKREKLHFSNTFALIILRLSEDIPPS